MCGATIATTTSSSTRTPAASATCCFWNLRQNSPQGVRIALSACVPGTTLFVSLPVVLMRNSLETDGRIDDGIQHVDNQVDDDELKRKQQHFSLDHRIVTHGNGVDQQAPEARPVEYDFNDNRAA